MPKIVDHDQRRSDLAEAVWRVIVREGVTDVSIRSVAAEAGWSAGALRHYFATRAELLAFACEHVIDRVSARVAAQTPTGDMVSQVEQVLLETMPADENRHVEASIAFSFLALGLGDPALARVHRLQFTLMHDLCVRLATHLAPDAGESEGRRLHAVVDGLSMHVLARHLTAEEMVAELRAHLEAVHSDDREAAR